MFYITVSKVEYNNDNVKYINVIEYNNDNVEYNYISICWDELDHVPRPFSGVVSDLFRRIHIT